MQYDFKKIKTRGMKWLYQFCPECNWDIKLVRENKNSTSTAKSPILVCPECKSKIIIK